MKTTVFWIAIAVAFWGSRGASAEMALAQSGFSKAVYFDTASTLPIDRLALNEVVKWLGESDLSLVLEGHADERGSLNYNLELGDRRARQVKADLMALGVDPKRLIIMSRGESSPDRLGHLESSWEKNRRVLIYSMVDSVAQGEDTRAKHEIK